MDYLNETALREREPVSNKATTEQFTRDHLPGWGFVVGWVGATGAGTVLGAFLAEAITHSVNWTPSMDLKTIGSVASAIGILGLGLGSAQWVLLHRHVPKAQLWIPATAIGLMCSGGLGAYLEASGIASSFYGLVVSEALWDAIKGALMGAFIGVPQWLVLRGTQTTRALSWPVVCTFAAAIGIGLASFIWRSSNRSGAWPQEFPMEPVSPIPAVLLGLLTFGVISGVILVWILRGRTVRSASVL